MLVSGGRGGGFLWRDVLPVLSLGSQPPLNRPALVGPWAPASGTDGTWFSPLTVRVTGRSLGSAAAAVLPVVPAVQLCLSVQLLLPCGECPPGPAGAGGGGAEVGSVGQGPGAVGGLTTAVTAAGEPSLSSWSTR